MRVWAPRVENHTPAKTLMLVLHHLGGDVFECKISSYLKQFLAAAPLPLSPGETSQNLWWVFGLCCSFEGASS